MGNLFSVWLVPQEDDEIYLSNIIKDLGKEHNAPVFTPHLTLLGNVTIDYDKLKSVIDTIFQNVKPFRIKKIGLNQSEDFFKTVFIECELDENLKVPFERISSKTDKRSVESFKPHISLIYKTLSKDERIKIIEEMNIKNKFVIDNVYIVAPREGQKDWYDVGNWRILYKKSFV